MVLHKMGSWMENGFGYRLGMVVHLADTVLDEKVAGNKGYRITN